MKWSRGEESPSRQKARGRPTLPNLLLSSATERPLLTLSFSLKGCGRGELQPTHGGHMVIRNQPLFPALLFEKLPEPGSCSLDTGLLLAALLELPDDPHLGLGPGRNVPLQGRQGYRGRIPVSPGGSRLVSSGSKGLHYPLESRHVTLGAQ